MDAETFYSQPKGLRWLVGALWVLALAGLLYLVGLTVWLGLTGLFFPYQLSHGEGFMLHFVQEWSAGRPIYKAAEGYPYIFSNYPPLATLLALALTPFFGITYLPGRLWALLAIVVLAALLVAWVRRETGRWRPAAVAALFFVGSPYIYHWAPLYRADLIGLALTLGGLYTVHLAFPPKGGGNRGQQRPRLLWLAVLLFVAALYTKQSFLFAPAAALVYLFLFVDRRSAIRMAVAMAVLGGGLFLLINTLTNGGFWYAMVISNINPFLWPQFWKQQATFFGTFAMLALLTAWYVADKFILDHTTSLQEKVSPIDLYLPAALISLWFVAKAGSWENYFFEALAAFALCAGLGLARLGRGKAWPYQVLAPLCVLVQVGLMWHTPRVAERFLELTRQSNEAMAPILAGIPDPILSEDMGLLVTNGKVMDYNSFQYSQLARVGRWDQHWELGQLRNRRFSAVILEQGTRLDPDHYQRFTREFLSELDRNYRLTQTVGKYEIYQPDPLQHERRVEFADKLALVGWSVDVPPEIRPGGTLTLTAVWQAQEALAEDYTAFAHVIDGSGRGWGGDDHRPYDGLYPTTAWGAGEMVRDTFTLTVPTDAPSGLYDIQVGWYPSAPPTAGGASPQERLPIAGPVAGAGSIRGGDSFRVAVLPVGRDGIEAQPRPGLTSLTPVAAQFGAAISLKGYAWKVDPEALHLTIRWSADRTLDQGYTVFVHLIDQKDGARIVAQGDAPPLGGRWPTDLWLPGVEVDDLHTLPLPRDLRPGSYALLVGLYDPSTGTRLTLTDGSDALRLAEIHLP